MGMYMLIPTHTHSLCSYIYMYVMDLCKHARSYVHLYAYACATHTCTLLTPHQKLSLPTPHFTSCQASVDLNCSRGLSSHPISELLPRKLVGLTVSECPGLGPLRDVSVNEHLALTG